MKRTHCKQCTKKLSSDKRQYCTETCSRLWFNAQAKQAKKLKREREAVTRHCAYVECGKELERSAHAQARYCAKPSKCYMKQNALEAKERKERLKKEGKIKMALCNNDNCQEEYVYHPRRKYCCTKCRKDQNNLIAANRHKGEVRTYKETKHEALATNGNTKEINLQDKHLTRGKIHYAGYNSL